MENKIQFKTKLNTQGKISIRTTIPLQLCEYLNLKNGDQVIMTADHGKYGRFITIWKNTEYKNENANKEEIKKDVEKIENDETKKDVEKIEKDETEKDETEKDVEQIEKDE